MSEIDVLLLAAGLGTRLRPLTDQIPKALLPVYGTPLVGLHIERLLAPAESGPAVGRIVVNAHHLAPRIAAYIGEHRLRERIEISHEPEILGTGGAIAKAAPRLRSDPFAALNADALFAAPLAAAFAFHTARDAAATLVLLRDGAHPLVRAEGDRVAEILRDPAAGAFTFTGFQVVSRAFAALLPGGVFHDVRDTYRRLAREGRLGAFIFDPPEGAPFLDVGTPGSYLEAHRLCAGPAGDRLGLRPRAGGARVEGYGHADASARVGRDARIERSVVLPDAEIGRGVRVSDSIIGPGARIERDVERRLVTTLGGRAIGEPGGGR